MRLIFLSKEDCVFKGPHSLWAFLFKALIPVTVLTFGTWNLFGKSVVHFKTLSLNILGLYCKKISLYVNLKGTCVR